MYLLDTNILSELVRRLPDPRVEARFESEPERLFTSVIWQVGNVDPPTVIPSKVIAISNPIEVLRGRRVLLQGAASPGLAACASRPLGCRESAADAH